MKTWKRWKRTLQLIFDPTTRQIAAAIRLGETKERNRAKREAQTKPFVYINQAGQKAAQSQIGTYEPPEKQTDPFAEIHQRLQNRRVRIRHDTTSLAHKIQLPDTKTEILPNVKPPQKYHMQRLYAEPDSTFNAL